MNNKCRWLRLEGVMKSMFVISDFGPENGSPENRHRAPACPGTINMQF